MKHLLIKLIRFYQKYISVQTTPSCRFIPTCSHYAIEAIEKYGALKGGFLAIKRILRCHPFGKMGYDPVPSKEENKWYLKYFAYNRVKLNSNPFKYRR